MREFSSKGYRILMHFVDGKVINDDRSNILDVRNEFVLMVHRRGRGFFLLSTCYARGFSKKIFQIYLIGEMIID